MTATTDILSVRWLGRRPYESSWQAMQEFTNQRTPDTEDEIWLLEHEPVFTLGQNGKTEHLLTPGEISVVKTDRGGQVTYHGPGQLMVYTLIDLKRKKLNVRDFVCAIEKAVMGYLQDLGITAKAKREAPGVYAGDDQRKICSIGLRIRRGYAYHGIAFNLNMNLEPFTRINPCGFQGLKMTQLADFLPENSQINTLETGLNLTQHIMKQLKYSNLRQLT